MNTTTGSWSPGTRLNADVFARRCGIPPSVSVMMRDGHITLEGVVGWHYERVGAECAVKRMRGVKSVFNNIMVEPGKCGRSTRER
jgi:osmotically-inducible protein OsmY